MVEPPPSPSLVVIESQLILEFLIIPLDPPSNLGELDSRNPVTSPYPASATTGAGGRPSCLPNTLQYCRVTPTECFPFFGIAVSSTTHCSNRGVPLQLRKSIVPGHAENRSIIPGRRRHEVM